MKDKCFCYCALTVNPLNPHNATGNPMEALAVCPPHSSLLACIMMCFARNLLFYMFVNTSREFSLRAIYFSRLFGNLCCFRKHNVIFLYRFFKLTKIFIWHTYYHFKTMVYISRVPTSDYIFICFTIFYKCIV